MMAVILAGGFGTRIQNNTQQIPKPLIPVAGKPVLLRQIETLKAEGFTDFIFTVHHMADQIMEYFGDGSRFGVHIRYFYEKTPMGTGGALFYLQDELQEDFLLLNADLVFQCDLQNMVAYHQKKQAIATLFVHPNNHPYDSGLIVCDDNGMAVDWITRSEPRPQWYANVVNAGIQILSPKIFCHPAILERLELSGPGDIPKGKVNLDKDILQTLVRADKVAAYRSYEYVRDMGTPARLQQAQQDLMAGLVAKRDRRCFQKAVFMDRDGTVNQYVGFLRNIDDFRLIDGVAAAIQTFHDLGYLVIVVTNQAVIARGEVTRSQLRQIHNKMETLLGHEGTYLDGVYYCPHHPDSGFPGEIRELKFQCTCRKPQPGMLLQAQKDFHLDLSQCWIIGDGSRDIQAGKAAGCHTARIADTIDPEAEVTVSDLFAFSQYLKDQALTDQNAAEQDASDRHTTDQHASDRQNKAAGDPAVPDHQCGRERAER